MGLEPSFSHFTPAGSSAGNGVSPPEREAPAATAGPARRWPLTVAASFILHGAIAAVLVAAPMAWYAAPADQAENEGTDQVGMMVAGNADSDQLMAGEATQVTLIPIVETRPVETAQAEPVNAEPVNAEPVPTEPVNPEPAAEAVEQAQAEEAPATETVEPDRPTAESPAPEEVLAAEVPAAETVTTPQTVAVLPQPRPARQPRQEKKAQPTGQPVQEQAKRPAAKNATAGSGGASESDSKRGISDGASEGKVALASHGGAKSGIGNAAVSNYPGKVAAKLRRVARNISSAAKASAVNNAQVSFVVGAGGDVRSVRLVKSSGSAGLDDAAVSIIRRAAPFPPIPAQAGREHWAFTLPIGPF